MSVAAAQLLLQEHYIASLMLYLDVVETEQVATAEVDGVVIRVNPAFVQQLTASQRKTLLAHEVLHPALGNCFSFRKGKRDDIKWQIACDYAVNQILAEAKFEPLPNWLYNKEFKDMSAEEIYECLSSEDTNVDIIIKDLANMSDFDENTEKENKKEDMNETTREKPRKKRRKGKQEEDEIREKQDSQKTESDNEKRKQTKRNEEQERKLAKQWEENLLRSIYYSKQRGEQPDYIQIYVNKILNPQLPWQLILDQFLGETLRDDYNERLPDRRLYTLGIIYPDLETENMKNIIIAVDTSGSISEGEIQEFLSEIQEILFVRGVMSVRLIGCDAKIHYDEILNYGENVPNIWTGRGGTDFRPVFERIEKETILERKPACLLYFTDLFGEFPVETPSFPVLWITKTKTKKPPFGNVLYLSSEWFRP
ncbi:MAG: VWA-like domain-containing protein [Thermoplasmata archaeon]